MTIILWAVLALVAGLVALALGARRTLRGDPPIHLEPGESLEPTLLERLARRALLVGLLPVVLVGGIIAWAGPARFYDDDTVRTVVTLLLLAALIVFSAFAIRARTWVQRAESPLDERDRKIFEKAPGLEGGPMMVTLALWVVGLQQAFWDQGAVPLVYLYLVFWSLLMVKALALPIGVLIGYRRN